MISYCDLWLSIGRYVTRMGSCYSRFFLYSGMYLFWLPNLWKAWHLWRFLVGWIVIGCHHFTRTFMEAIFFCRHYSNPASGWVGLSEFYKNLDRPFCVVWFAFFPLLTIHKIRIKILYLVGYARFTWYQFVSGFDKIWLLHSMQDFISNPICWKKRLNVVGSDTVNFSSPDPMKNCQNCNFFNLKKT